MNRILISGLATELENKTTQDGMAIFSFRLTPEVRKGTPGNIRVTFFDTGAEIARERVGTGVNVLVDGALHCQLKNYEGRDYTQLEIRGSAVLALPTARNETTQTSNGVNVRPAQKQQTITKTTLDNDEIPF